MSYSCDVLIIGAGVGGLSLALRLAAKGYRVRILQQREPPLPVYRPEIVQPAALQAFAELGLLNRLMTKAVARVDTFQFYRIGGKRLSRVSYRMLEHSYPYTLIGLPYHLRRVLLDSLGAYSSVHVHWGTQLTGVLRRGSHVLGVKAVENGQEQQWRASVTVGSDGCRSRFREAVGIDCRIKSYRNAFLGMLLRHPLDGRGEFDGMVHYYLGRGEILACFPCSSTALCLLFMVPAGASKTTDGQALSALRSRVCAIAPALDEPLSRITSWEQVSYLAPVRVRVATWVTDGAALMGDAAHACHPHVAQGVFHAMEDARVLAEVLETCFARGNFSARALVPYELTRRPVVECLQRVADEYAWLWETKNPLFTWLRDRIFRNVGQVPKLLQRIVAIEAGIETKPLSLVERLQALGVCT